jgi:hypothetical protein
VSPVPVPTVPRTLALFREPPPHLHPPRRRSRGRRTARPQPWVTPPRAAAASSRRHARRRTSSRTTAPAVPPSCGPSPTVSEQAPSSSFPNPNSRGARPDPLSDVCSLADVEDFYAQCDPGESRLGAASRFPTRSPCSAWSAASRAARVIVFGFFGRLWGWAEKENLCLYGYANEAWEVALPAEEVPTELPEPALGINFARDGMNRRDWLVLVAVHSDSWLIAVAFYYAARLNRNDR